MSARAASSKGIMPGVPACPGTLCLCSAVASAAKQHQAGMGLVCINTGSISIHAFCAIRASCGALGWSAISDVRTVC